MSFKMSSEYIIGLGAILAGIGALIGGYGAFRSSKEQGKEQAALRNKAEEIAALYKKIAELNENIAGSVTGGNSYCYVTCINDYLDQNICEFVLITNGKFPMYDVVANITDYRLVHKLESHGEGYSRYDKGTTSITIGNVLPGRAASITRMPLPNDIRHDFIVEFSARNGIYIQWVKLRKINGKWKHAYRVVKSKKVNTVDNESGIIYEKIDPGYPLNDKKEVEWNDQNPFKQ
jgi:hypothetical protein